MSQLQNPVDQSLAINVQEHMPEFVVRSKTRYVLTALAFAISALSFRAETSAAALFPI